MPESTALATDKSGRMGRSVGTVRKEFNNVSMQLLSNLSNNQKAWLIMAGISLGLGAIAYVMPSQAKTTRSTCREEMLERAHFPRTVRFKDEAFSQGGTQYQVTVHAKNGFGVPITAEVNCTVGEAGEILEFVSR